MRNKTLKRIGTASLAASMTFTSLGTSAITIFAKDDVSTRDVDAQGYNVLGSVVSVTKDKNKITFTISTGERVRFTFLEENVFRMYMAPAGTDFQEYPTANSKDHTATITNKTDDAYETQYKVSPDLTETDEAYTIKTSKAKIEIKKSNSLMKAMKADGTVVWEETAPLKWKNGSTVQTLKTDKDEYFYGGGTQNGRFSHKGNIINVEKEGSWVDQGVASPSPFYWSTDGYGVLRNTWKPGKYDFAKTNANEITTAHDEKRFDAFYFIDDKPEDILNDYYELTGNPAELPEYASYLGHLNCYNRDYWLEVPQGTSGALQMGDKWYKESQTNNGGVKETLLGDANTTAQQVIEDHKSNDMPLGWFLPNDGYGCGYGQEATQAGDIQNLKNFSDYSISNGIQTGLWTQSNLWPADSTNPQKGERDIYKEVEAGVHSVKTDVAWVGPGYSMALNGISVAYDAIASKSGMKPNIVTLNGWAGTQRYGGIWTGDQYGGQWEYIRFHIPTYIGTSLSGQPNIGSDMDGIFGGKNKNVWTRDFQWKAFTTYMLDMDGWGSNAKTPWALGEDGTSINRTYLKLKAQLAPYTNTISHTATALGKLPMIRAMFLEEKNAYTLGKATEYQYMYGDNFLVAPIYQETAVDGEGNDIRNNIYLPSTSDVWFDYFTGEQYRGGQILNNFDAPIWKLPLFVKNGSIIPMYPENNNPEAISSTNKDGLDRSQRIVEFYPHGDTEFSLYEDDGKTLGGASATTMLKSSVKDGKATLSADKTIGGYTGMVKERSNEFVVNVSQAPKGVTGNVAGKDVTFTKVNTQEEYDNAKGNVYFYNEAPSILVKEFASKGSKFENTEETTRPKLYVKSAEKVDITANSFKVIVDGFKNEQNLGKDELNTSIAIPSGLSEVEKSFNFITVGWDEVAGAETYDVEVDGNVYRNIKTEAYTQKDLAYLSDHTFRVRTVTKDGYSEWSELLNVQTADNPYRNVPADMTGSFEGGEPPAAYSGKFENMFDEDNKSQYSSAAANAWLNKSLIIDMKKSYQMDKLEYICRENMGNGAVKKWGVSYSNDGMTWTEYGDIVNDVKNSSIVDGNEDGRQFWHTFDTKFNARYLRLTVKDSTGGFLDAYAIRPYIVDGTKGRVVGDGNNSGAIDDNDLVFYQNYMGITPRDSDYEYVTKTILGDVDGNELIDAYDVSYVARQLGDPVTNPAKGVDGKIQLIPSKTNLKAGDVFTVDVYGIGLKNVNAFSVEIPVDTDQFSTGNATATISSMFMKNLSQERKHSDNSVDNYVSFVNIGKQELINGTGSLAKVTVTAKTDFVWDTKETHAVLVGQDLSKVNAIIDNTIIPEAPETKKILSESDIKSITFDNDVAKNIDPTKLWQQSNWKTLLFDGKTDGLVEFKWFTGPTSITDEVKVPLDMNISFNSNEPLKKIRVYNRGKGSNGTIMKMKAVAYKGATEYNLGTINEFKEIYEFDVPANAKDGIDRVVITPLETNGKATGVASGSESNRMLSLFEIQFETDSAISATSIKFDSSSASKTTINGLKEVSATVLPNNSSNPFYNITSSDESIAKVIKVPTEKSYYFAVQGVSAGKVTLTATSEDGNFTDTMEFEVIAGVDTSKLDESIAKASSLYGNLYTKDSYDVVANSVKKAKELIVKDGVTQSEIDEVTLELAKAMKELEFKGSNAEQPDSADIIDQATMSRYDESSFATAEKQDASNVIDGNSETIWHSNYSSGYKLPQYVTIDLGSNYMLEQVNMLARQGGVNGHITHYRIEVSKDEGEEKVFTPVVEGFFDNDGTSLDNPGEEKTIKFDKTEARYVRFIAIEALGGTKNAYASIAELNFFGKEKMTLSKAIQNAKTYLDSEAAYTTSSFESFKVAYDAAVALSENVEATDDEKDIAINKLTNSISNLELKAEQWVIDQVNSHVEAYSKLASDYTEKEFEKMAYAIEVAKEVLAKDVNDISVREIGSVDAKLILENVNLNKAMSATDLLANLDEAVSIANLLLPAETLSADSKDTNLDALKEAIKKAQDLIDNNSTDKDAIRASITEVLNASLALWDVVNKDELVSLVNVAKNLNGNYTTATKKALNDAIDAAKVVIKNNKATTEDVTNALESLTSAIDNLKTLANKEALSAQVQITNAIIGNIGSYIPSTVAGLESALAEANAILANEDATQAEVDEMTAILTTANSSAKVKADKTVLAETIANAKAMDLSKYTVSSVTALKNAIANAELVMNNEGATVDEINFAIEAINQGIKGLVEEITGTNPGNGGNSGNSGNTSGGENTGDETTATGFMAIMIAAGCAILAAVKKRSQNK